MPIHIYNTLTGEKEEFKPLKEGKVGMYNCGPTVYDYAHVGNLRAYVLADIIRRVFEYNDYNVTQIINITDVGHLVSDGDDGEDKMTKALKRENKPLTLEAMDEVSSFYTEKFINDLKQLNIEMPSAFPKASRHIAEDIEIIQKLEENGYAYATSDGVYFDTKKYKAYGKLGHISLDDSKNESRIVINPEKRNLTDFTLWKLDKNLGWESPWGKGFPGWHIECSAMSRKYLGQPFDIHTGGVDHIPVHHNNEIAQSEAAYGEELAHYWIHGAMMNINDGKKMSKSSGGFLKLANLEEAGISPIAFRYWLLTSHYRTQVNFTVEAVKAAQNAFIRLVETFIRLGEVQNEHVHAVAEPKDYAKEFEEKITNDFDTAGAVALMWDLIKDHSVVAKEKIELLLSFDEVFGLGLHVVKDMKDEMNEAIPAEITALAEAREIARAAKEFDKADALRKEIASRGYEVKDNPEGYILRVVK